MDNDVIFDTNAAKRFQRFNFLPVEVLAELPFAPRRQQGFNKVDTRLDGQHHTRLDHARAAQVRIFRRRRQMGTGIILHKAGDIMHLQAQRVADAVRHKRPGQVVFDHRLFAHVGDDLMFTQQLSNALMELDVVIHVAGADFQRANQRQLLVINVLNQLGKVAIAVRGPGAREIRRIAVIFRTGIEQEAARFRRRAVIQFGVVQHGGAH